MIVDLDTLDIILYARGYHVSYRERWRRVYRHSNELGIVISLGVLGKRRIVKYWEVAPSRGKGSFRSCLKLKPLRPIKHISMFLDMVDWE